MSEEYRNLFELIRREGLIVIALGALAWQVYYVTTGFSEADKLWRAEMAAWRTSSLEEAQSRTEANIALTTAIQQAEDRIAHIEDIAERMERECKVLMAIDEYKNYLEYKNEQ